MPISTVLFIRSLTVTHRWLVRVEKKIAAVATITDEHGGIWHAKEQPYLQPRRDAGESYKDSLWTSGLLSELDISLLSVLVLYFFTKKKLVTF